MALDGCQSSIMSNVLDLKMNMMNYYIMLFMQMSQLSSTIKPCILFGVVLFLLTGKSS